MLKQQNSSGKDGIVKECISVEESISRVEKIFPFARYMQEKTVTYKNIAETVVRHLEKGGIILDFGSGPCDKTAVLQLLGYSCFACDDLMDNWHKIGENRERIIFFSKKCGICFERTQGGLPSFSKGTFDMIMLHDVLEHLHDSPRDLLNDLLEFLKPGGLVFVTVPNAANIRKRIHLLCGETNLPDFDTFFWSPGPWRGHVREYVRSDLILLSRYLDLQVLELRSCDHMLEKLSAGIIRSIYLVATHFFRGWKDSWLLVARKPEHWIPRKILPRDESAATLGRCPRHDRRGPDGQPSV